MSNEPKREQPWVDGQAWEALQKKQLLMAHGCPKRLAEDILSYINRTRLEDDAQVDSILRVWGVTK